MRLRGISALAVVYIAAQYPAAAATKPISMLSPNIVESSIVQDQTYLATADFNGDGKSDLAACIPVYQSEAVTLSIFLSNGDGTFQGALNTTIPNVVGGLQVADFNGDGKADLAVLSRDTLGAQTGADLLMFLGNGDGTFQAPIHNQLADLAGPLFVADFNHDGRPDVMTGSLSSPAGSNIYLGTGNGTFGSPSYSPFGPTLIADFNGDGIPDAVALEDQPVSLVVLHLGLGNGAFDSGRSISEPIAAGQIGSFAVGDVNNDGKPDLIVSAASPGISSLVEPYVAMAALLGNGDGTFQTALPFSGLGGALTLTDLNKDGNLDLVSDYSILPGNGDGTFGSPIFLAAPFSTCEFDMNEHCKGGTVTTLAADLNGDGLPDLIQLWSWSPGPVSYTTLTSFINDSPGDGFLVPGVLAPTGAAPIGLNSIVTAYGVNMAPSTASASGPPYPTTLGGIQLYVGGSLAPLIYVSPTQINYLMPQVQVSSPYMNPTALPITIQRVGQPLVPKGLALVTMLDTPALFTVDSSGVAAATAVRIAPDGTQTPVPVFNCSTSPCTAVPIDLSGNPVYLSLYGTGMTDIPTGFNGLSKCTAYGPVTYFGPQGQIPGLQQINILLSQPPGVAGGKTGISCSLIVATESSDYTFTSNTVYISIK